MKTDEFSYIDSKSTQGGWLAPYEAKFERDPDYIAEHLAILIVEQALGMMERKGISRAQLSDLMGVSRSYITRVFNAPPNLTLRSIAHLALALGTKPHASIYPTCSAEQGEVPS
ncbi:MAG: helix-turn-helix transcriptional regulator [Chloroflexi bacterium]|nr:helix-turn-helix transcriptional regulator [Chloroflexota bacterium]